MSFLEAKRRRDREAKARKRAAMTKYEKHHARAEHDATYREKNREQRRDYMRERRAA